MPADHRRRWANARQLLLEEWGSTNYLSQLTTVQLKELAI
eukprot:gene17466-14708_t